MGKLFQSTDFTTANYREFSVRLNRQLQELREEIKMPSFNREHFTLGAELETYLVDDDNAPADVNQKVIELAGKHPSLTTEINRYNLEMNLSPVETKNCAPFRKIEEEMHSLLEMLQKVARQVQTNIVFIGILPTLKQEHLSEEHMTDEPRYHSLSKSLCHKPYRINITGKDSLQLAGEGCSAEGANTSFQIHLRVPADRFANYYNAAQLVTPLLLSFAANSPLVLGKRLWQESRIALFKQSIDFRDHDLPWRQPARVSFGHGWIRKEAWELFAESIGLYEPIVPVLYDDGGPDDISFPELLLHHGTVWSWNRGSLRPGKGRAFANRVPLSSRRPERAGYARQHCPHHRLDPRTSRLHGLLLRPPPLSLCRIQFLSSSQERPRCQTGVARDG